MRTELILPNDTSYLRIARAYVRELATLAELPSGEVEALVLATDEACTNTIEHAFEPGESGEYKLVGELTPTTLTLAIHDQGLPFDSSLAPTYTPPTSADASQVSTRGMGLYLIHQATDQVQWINHGREGKELRLVKHRSQADVTERLPAAELTPFRSDEPQASPQNYVIRRLRPEEAIWVAQCIYRAYGYTYPNDDLYYPERIAHQNETGELISAVAVNEAGELVGHCALERPGLGPVPEIGQAVVSPAHRKTGLLGRMTTFLEEEVRQMGLPGMFGRAVTSHTYSQRVIDNFGFRVCGVLLGLLPRSVSFKKIKTEPLPQRESCALCFKHVTPPTTAITYAPAHHQEMLQRIYDYLQVPVEFKTPEPPSDEPGQVAVSFPRSLGCGMIRVLRVGADTITEIRRARRDLCDIMGVETVYLELPLAQAGTPDVCHAAEADGFFFSGLGPHFAPDGDILHLQYLNVELDPLRLQIFSPFGQELLAYIIKDRDKRQQGV
jgi:anti-sigma regulatory factor (Ser/Thr protein kinase)/predicted N-acetyltransferase YhbS